MLYSYCNIIFQKGDFDMFEKILDIYNKADVLVSENLLIPKAIVIAVMFVSLVLGIVTYIRFSVCDPKKNIFLMAKKKRDEASRQLYKSAMENIKTNTASSVINIMFPGNSSKAITKFIVFFIFIPAIVMVLAGLTMFHMELSIYASILVFSAIISISFATCCLFYAKKRKDFEKSLYNAMFVLNNRLKLSAGDTLTSIRESVPYFTSEFKGPFSDFLTNIGTKGSEKSFYILRTVYHNEFYRELCDILRIAEFNSFSPENSIAELQESILVNNQDISVSVHQRVSTVINIFVCIALSVIAVFTAPYLHDKINVEGLPAVFSIVFTLIGVQIICALLAVGTNE